MIVFKEDKELKEAGLTLTDLMADSDYQHFNKALIRSVTMPLSGQVHISFPLFRRDDLVGLRVNTVYYSDKSKKITIAITDDMVISMAPGKGNISCQNKQIMISLIKQ